MSTTVEEVGPGGPAAPARFAGAARSNAWRYFLDRFAARFVTLSGITIILAILAILVVILLVVYPLVLPASAKADAAVRLAAGTQPLALAVDEYRETALVASAAGLAALPLHAAGPAAVTVAPPDGTRVTSAHFTSKGRAVLGLSDGRLLPMDVSFNETYENGARRVVPILTAGAPISVTPGQELTRFRYVSGPNGPIVVASGPRELTIVTVTESQALVGEATSEERRLPLPVDLRADISALTLDGRGDDVFVGTVGGQVARVSLRDPEAPKLEETVAVASAPGAAVTALGFLNGDRTLIVGDSAGAVSSWQVVQSDRGERRLTLIHRFKPHPGAVRAISPSRRDKGFVTADATGSVMVRYGTTGRTLLDLPGAKGEVSGLVFAPKADGVLAASADGQLHGWSIRNPHPEITWRTLFGKVWYEGYQKPDWVWQSTGGTDDFEAKFSLTPLIYGTLKGTFYALVFAVPLALLGALYTALFMHPSLKAILKPTVELMAALPSVVLGFIAGLWLAPAVERIVPGIVVFFVVLPLLVLLVSALWMRLPVSVRARFKPGSELLVLVPVVLLGLWLSIEVGRFLEAGLMAGDYRSFLLSALGFTYDQRNSLVVGLAMGFAVIPIIFTVAEDSIAGVPAGLTAGSLALGATRWQTALRTVLPTASPGIFSAVMIGFGRAVGETMIVLMATGNTPVMNPSIFSGLRALSANIAVELPEAPENGTLFRVLFLAALLLYLMTFLVNTAAELVRLRLRQKYRTYE